MNFHLNQKSVRSLPACFLILFTIILFTSGCKKKSEDPEPITDVQLTKLSKTWKLTGVTLDGVSKLSEYSSFQLVLAGTKGADLFTYTTASRPSRSPWPGSGNWTFGADPVTQIIRDPQTDAVAMTYSVNDHSLQLSFKFTGTGYTARISELTGQWVFTFEL